MLNCCSIMGRFTKDPDVRYTASQTPVVSFTLAVERDVKDDKGERKVDFIDCVAWRELAEMIGKYYAKGRMAVASGRIQVRDWETKEGEKRRSTELVVTSMYFADSKKKDGESSDSTSTETRAQDIQTAPTMVEIDDDSELPF